MKWFDNWKNGRIERAKKMYADAQDAMNAVESPYVTANRFISEYEKAVKFKPGSAYKFAKKAYRAAIDESEAAKTHLKAFDLLSNQKKLDDRKIAKLENEYMANIAAGKLKKAKNLAFEMHRLANSQADPCPVAIRVDFSNLKDGKIRIVVTNRGPQPLVINSVSASSGSAALDLGSSMSEGLPPNVSLTRDVDIDPESSQEVSVMVEYESGFETNTVRKHFPILRGV